MKRKVQVQAHRGAMAYAPENTLPAFQMAIDMGADGIECDIHLTKDGQFVVCHDPTIDRTSTGKGSIVDLTLEEIKSYDFGVKFDEKYKGTTAPTLGEMLDVVKNMNPINIEIKKFGGGRDDAEVLDQLYELLKEKNVIENTIVSSFDAPLLKLFKQRHGDIYTCLLYTEKLGAAEFARKLGCSAIHPHLKKLKKVTVNSAHARGIKVNSWTINEESDIRKMIEIGCDGVITNYPDRAVAIAEEE
ncbi:MAG: glycerophosphodiester phosphodiesterase [Clostridia bacterium]|nr:glycerophosphodiester phosphodiesterase [Clostridia bacterium]